MELPEGCEYVALGSSYAAGPGLGDRVAGSPWRAARSEHNYAHLVAERLRLRLVDATFSGATVAQIVGSAAGSRQPRQLDAVTPATRLITLTGGGNDLGYIGYLMLASAGWPLRVVLGGKRRLAELEDAAATDRNAAALSNNLDVLFARIRERAPQAAVVVTDYLAVLPPDLSIPSPPLSPAAAANGAALYRRVNRVLAESAYTADVTFVEVSTPSAAHHAWSREPLTEKFVLRGGEAAAYHPLRSGMIAVADAVEAALSAA